MSVRRSSVVVVRRRKTKKPGLPRASGLCLCVGCRLLDIRQRTGKTCARGPTGSSCNNRRRSRLRTSDPYIKRVRGRLSNSRSSNRLGLPARKRLRRPRPEVHRLAFRDVQAMELLAGHLDVDGRAVGPDRDDAHNCTHGPYLVHTRLNGAFAGARAHLDVVGPGVDGASRASAGRETRSPSRGSSSRTRGRPLDDVLGAAVLLDVPWFMTTTRSASSSASS